jgi:chromosome segregation ATPase
VATREIEAERASRAHEIAIESLQGQLRAAEARATDSDAQLATVRERATAEADALRRELDACSAQVQAAVDAAASSHAKCVDALAAASDARRELEGLRLHSAAETARLSALVAAERHGALRVASVSGQHIRRVTAQVEQLEEQLLAACCRADAVDAQLQDAVATHTSAAAEAKRSLQLALDDGTAVRLECVRLRACVQHLEVEAAAAANARAEQEALLHRVIADNAALAMHLHSFDVAVRTLHRDIGAEPVSCAVQSCFVVVACV